MDFGKLLLEADRNQKELTKQSQQIKRLNTHFTAPAKKEERSSQPKSEALQKLIAEKEREKQQKKEVVEKEIRRKEKEKEEREREQKRKNTFRIPKKTAIENYASDAESFSSISSDDEPQLKSGSVTDAHKSSSEHSHGERSHRSSSHRRSEKRDGHSLKLSEHKHSEKRDGPSGKTSEHSSSQPSKLSSGKHSSEKGDHHSNSDKNKHHHSASDRSKHSQEKGELDSNRAQRSSDKNKSHSDSSHSRSHKSHHSSDKPQHKENKDRPSSAVGSQSHKDKSQSDGNHSQYSKSDHSSNKLRHKDKKDRTSAVVDSQSHKDKSRSDGNHSQYHKSRHSPDKQTIKECAVMENDSSGYITSPDISSEDEDSPSQPPAKHSNQETHASVVGAVALSRTHLKPTIERKGGCEEQRQKMLEKLQAIKERMAGDDQGERRKRSAWGEVKKRRAKREKLDGDFRGSCMEKIEYDTEEKPSLKRPEPRPEDPKPEKIVKKHHREKHHRDKLGNGQEGKSHRLQSDSRGPVKVNRFDKIHEKPKIKPKPRPQPPPVSFADLMKIAEEKHVQPVMVTVTPKKKEERRPLTQDEIDRKEAREKWLKSKECREYRYGTGANTEAKDSAVKSDSASGGFLRQNHSVIPTESDTGQSNSFSIPRKRDVNGNAKTQKPSSLSESKHPPTSSVSSGKPAPGQKLQPHPTSSAAPKTKHQPSSSQSTTGRKPQPHPMRPGTIANKPRAMAQHANGERKSELARPDGELKRKNQVSSQNPSSKPRPRDSSSVPPRPQSSGGVSGSKSSVNAWDALFSRAEYKKMAQPAPKKRMNVIDSEEEDYYEDDEGMDDFIADDDEEGPDVSWHIREMFGYDKRKYRYDDDDDDDMEASFSQVMKEEARSARLGLKEDLEDIRREQEELRQKALKKKKMRK